MWETPSLAVGWRVRDVVAHIVLAPQHPGAGALLVGAVRAGGSFNRLNHDLAVRHASRPTGRLLAELREHAASRRLPAVTSYQNLLFDTLVHIQDIAIPLAIEQPMPVEAAGVGATRVWTMGWPWWARRRLRGFRLVATDVDWSIGAGTEVRGPIAAILLVLTGRPAGLSSLTGEGAAALGRRLVEAR